jgi:hypothetical protein
MKNLVPIRLFYSVVFGFVSLLCANAGELPSKSISPELARELVYQAVQPHSPGAHVTILKDRYEKDFYYCSATWDNPVGSPVIGYFMVNPWTGHVWDVMGISRRLITNLELERSLASIRKRLKVNDKEYFRLRALKPYEEHAPK